MSYNYSRLPGLIEPGNPQITLIPRTRRLYYNLTKKCYSIQHKTDKGWRLLEHANTLLIENSIYSVSQATRKRIITEKKKYVHAYLIFGEYKILKPQITEMYGTPVTYNPYKDTAFVTLMNDTRNPIDNLPHDYYLTIHDDKPMIFLRR